MMYDMIGNDIIDLSCVPAVTGKHLIKYYSSNDLDHFGIDEYWKILALKESAWKCVNKLIGLNSFIPPHFTIDSNMGSVKYFSLILPVILLEINTEYIHTIVGSQGVSGWNVCSEGSHRISFAAEYYERTGINPDVVRYSSDLSPNGLGPPVIVNDKHNTSVTFSHDGRFSSYAYKINVS
jgi:hypothetical protein